MPISPKSKTYLYVTHALQAFGDRSWQFAVPILFVVIWDGTLLPVAVFNLNLYLAALVLSPIAGSWLDRTDRLLAIKMAIVGQNFATILTSVFLLSILRLVSQNGSLDKANTVVWTFPLILHFIGLLACAVVAEIMGMLSTVSLEKDWVVVLAEDDHSELSALNKRMRQIDLVCKFGSPLVFGVVVELAKTSRKNEVVVGASIIILWNALTLFPEYYTAREIYVNSSRLQQPKTTPHIKTQITDLESLLGAWRRYARHSLFVPSLGYCLLYLTVLDGSTMMTAYLEWIGTPESVMGLSRGVGALFGLFGTFIFPFVLDYFRGSIVKTAMICLVLFWLLISPPPLNFLSNLSASHKQEVSSAYVLMVSVAISRLGLWSFDLAHTQLVQENVEEASRGVFNSCQTATYQCCYVILAVCSIGLSDPQQFPLLTFLSFAGVSLALLLYVPWGFHFILTSVRSVTNEPLFPSNSPKNKGYSSISSNN